MNMLCLNTQKKEVNKSEVVDGINVIYCPIRYSNQYNFARRLWVFIFFAVWATYKNLALKSDVTYATSTPLTVAIPAILGRLLGRKRYLFEVRDVWPEAPIALGYLNNPLLRKLAQILEKFAYKYSSSIISLSPDMDASIQGRLGFPTTIVPNFSSLSSIAKSEDTKLDAKLNSISKKHRYLIGYTGAIGKVNDVGYLVRLISRCKMDVGLVIFGAGNDEENVKRLVKQLNLEGKRVYFLDLIPKSNLHIVHRYLHLAASTVQNIPALSANSANKIFDAFAMGTPILINHEGWLKKLILKEQCGIALEPELTESEIQRLESFLSNRDRYMVARENALRLANQFCPDKSYSLVEREIEKIAFQK